LEAMASGVPVVASNSSSLPEVVGDAGILVDPRDVDSWTGAMKDVLSNKDVEVNLRERGLVKAAGFSWEQCAGETIKVYQDIIS